MDQNQHTDEKIHYLVYKTTNTVNGMIYIGKHQTTDVDDLYLGSGTYLRKAINKYGVSSFKKEILFDFSSEKEMLDKERELVDEDFVKRRDTYNCVVGGQGVFTKEHGNHGTNTTFRDMNTAPKIYICNPYTMQKKKLLFTKEIPQDYIDAGWERGTLSKYNTTWLVFNGQKMSVAKFSAVNSLDKYLVFMRLSAGWTADEILAVPESLRLFKTEEDKAAYQTLKKQQTKEKIKKTTAARQQETTARWQALKKARHERNADIAKQWHNEYAEVGQKQFLLNHPELNIKKVLKYFREYIAEYKAKKRSRKVRLIEYNGKMQSLTRWCKELDINKWTVWKMLKTTNMSEAEILDFMINEKNNQSK